MMTESLRKRLKAVKRNKKRIPPIRKKQAGRAAELAVAAILNRRLKYTRLEVIAGVRVPDVRTGGRREFDFIITTQSDVILVELKNWSGRIQLKGERVLQHRRNGEVIDYGRMLEDLSVKQDTFNDFLTMRGVEPPPARTVLLFYNPRLDMGPGFSEVDTEILTVPEFLARLPDARDRIVEVLWRFIERLLGAPADESKTNPSLPSESIRSVRRTLGDLGTWDSLHLHGGHVLSGDILWVCDEDFPLSERDKVRRISVKVSRSYAKALLGHLLNYEHSCSLEAALWNGGRDDFTVPLDAVLYFHTVGQPQPAKIFLRHIEQITYGYRNSGRHLLRWRDLEEGEIYDGRVTGVCGFGVFVNIGAPGDGLMHISVIDDDKFTHPAELTKRFRVGQEVRVCISSIDLERQRISLELA